MLNISFSNKTQYLRNFFGFFFILLGYTRFNAFRFGSDPVQSINNGAALHCSHVAEQWRHREVQKKKKKGKGKRRRPWAVVRELWSTVLLREQWRHGSA
jgi:hypothetical protein